jgi:mono/diheme cytochrome c family protein
MSLSSEALRNPPGVSDGHYQLPGRIAPGHVFHVRIRGSRVMTRMSIAAIMVLASATLHGGQADRQRTTRPAPRPAAPIAAPTTPATTPAKPALVTSSPRRPAPMTVARQRQIVDQYCVTCHNSRAKTAGVVLDAVDLANVAPHAEVLEKAVRRVRAGLMPPVGMKRPDAATMTALAEGLEASLDRAAAGPNLVAPGLHRLNRTEYANAIRELLGVEIDAAAYLPVDDSTSGFDNVAAGLTVSPALVEGYMSAAGKISRLALGRATAPEEKRYLAPQDYSQEGHIEGLPFGTRGGLLIHNYFPANGEYLFSWFPVRGNTGELYGAESRDEQLIVLIDGVQVGSFDIAKLPQGTDNDKNELRIPVKAGYRTVGFTFLSNTQIPGDDLNHHYLRSVLDTNPIPGFTFYPQVGQVKILGPYNGTPATEVASRKKILVCTPATPRDEPVCARTVLDRVARRAFRRPLTADDSRVLMEFYQSGRGASGTFEDGIERGLQGILSDPEFVFRSETAPVKLRAGQAFRISDLELASRLAFFLWSTAPDDQLINLASRGQLSDPKVLAAQVRRLLADPRSRELVKNFAGQWLQLRNLPSAAPTTQMFPDFDDNLRQAFRTEAEMFFDSVLREDRSAIDLLNANYTFVNERLARHYGIPNVYGSKFRRVTLTGALEDRRGLLGKGAVLLTTSNPDRTSPVLRGKWVLMNILGVVPPDPPPNVPVLKESDKMANGQPVPLEISMRQRMQEHRASPVCASCHMMMDPIGFALESFDAIGKARTQEFGKPLDLSAQLTDGVKFEGPSGLRQALLRYSPQFVSNLTEKLFVYALGRSVDYRDMPQIRAIVREAAGSNYRMSSIILGIVNSPAFTMNSFDAEGEGTTEARDRKETASPSSKDRI